MENRPIALVTGASTGLGAEFARCAAKDGCDLLLVARRLDRLDALAEALRAEFGVKVETRAVDLVDRAALSAFAAEIADGHVRVDILVNNAGVGIAGPLAGNPMEALVDLVDLDVMAPTCLMRAALVGMKARRSGKILNVASLAGLQPGPNAAAYCAAKAYFVSLSTAVAYEMRGQGVTVTALCPGPVGTPFAAISGLAATRLFSNLLGVEDPVRIARKGWAAMQRGKTRLVPGLRPQLLAIFSPFTPAVINLAIAAFIFSPMRRLPAASVRPSTRTGDQT